MEDICFYGRYSLELSDVPKLEVHRIISSSRLITCCLLECRETDYELRTKSK